MKKLIDEQIREVAVRVAEKNNLEFVHAQVIGANRNLTVRIFIDKTGGITHEDLAVASRQIESVFDAEDFIPAAYTLEVSSPGLERELYSLKDFERFAGKLAKVKTNEVIDGQRNFRGRITCVVEDKIIFEDKTKGTVSFPYSAVAKANLEIDLEEELKGSKKLKVEGGK